jgi:hypothetical protein
MSQKIRFTGTRRDTLDFGDSSVEIERGKTYELEIGDEVERAVRVGSLVVLEDTAHRAPARAKANPGGEG